MSHVGATRPGVLNLPTNPHHSLQHHSHDDDFGGPLGHLDEFRGPWVAQDWPKLAEMLGPLRLLAGLWWPHVETQLACWGPLGAPPGPLGAIGGPTWGLIVP